MIPRFNEDGFLPPGVHVATLAEFEERFVTSTSSSRRRELFQWLQDVVLDAWRTSFVLHVYVAGSFVTAKPEPNDFDCLIVTDLTTWDAEVRPFEYNLLSVQAARRHFRGDVISVVEGSPRHRRYWEFFGFNRSGKSIGIVEITK
jgi:hypothetical protein